jgi:NADH-quinone oxidoreductase subunit H
MPTFSFWPTIITIVCVLGAILTICAYEILAERKISAWVQDRIGPNRVGPRGLLQPVADGLKFLLKEDIVPDHVDKVLFILAPALALSTALFTFAVVPFGPTTVPGEPGYSPDKYQFVIAPGLSIGIVFVFAIGSLNVYGVILGGWASNNKYSLLGALRSSAQLVSYEIPMGMSILGILLMSGSLNLEQIIAAQAQRGFFGWFVWYQPLAFLLFLTSVFAETNRLPFDLPEAEQELVGGYHTEYSAMKFAMFFLGEYAHMITTSFLLVILFFGGWHFPGLSGLPGLAGIMLKLVIFWLKMVAFIVFYMLVRWTIPRFRFDQLMALAWKVMIPLALVNLLWVMILQQCTAPSWVVALVSWLVLFVSAIVVASWPRETRRARRARADGERLEMAAR